MITVSGGNCDESIFWVGNINVGMLRGLVKAGVINSRGVNCGNGCKWRTTKRTSLKVHLALKWQKKFFKLFKKLYKN